MLGFGISAMLLSIMPRLAGTKPRVTMAILLILLSCSMVISSILFAAFAWDCMVNMQQGFIPLIMKLFDAVYNALISSAVLFVAIVFSSAKERIGKLHIFGICWVQEQVRS